MTELLTMARAAGFEETAPLHAAQLVFRPEVREMCRADRCSSYGRNWCCPPACPSLEEMTRRMQDYGDGVLVETVGAMSDDFDYEAIMAAETRHKERFRRLTETLYSRYGREAVLPMGAGTCRRCASCTCPHAPCRFPEEQVVSMEAYGLLVSQVCQDCAAGGVDALEPRSVAEVTGDVLLPLTGGQQLIPQAGAVTGTYLRTAPTQDFPRSAGGWSCRSRRSGSPCLRRHRSAVGKCGGYRGASPP